MSYTVNKAKGTVINDKGFTEIQNVFVVENDKYYTRESWMIDVYILGIQPSEDGDIVLPFIEYLIDNYPSVNLSRNGMFRGSIFTGLSIIEISFSEENDAKAYAQALNTGAK